VLPRIGREFHGESSGLALACSEDTLQRWRWLLRCRRATIPSWAGSGRNRGSRSWLKFGDDNGRDNQTSGGRAARGRAR
jgi:hypothetical protein